MLRLPGLLGEGVTLLDEAPETPAHLFAVRAFKTAIFGTPRRDQDDREEEEEVVKTGEGDAVRVDDESEGAGTVDVKSSPGKKNTVSSSTTAQLGENVRLDPLPSPAKGILLTPGTGTAKKKTVSFRPSKESAPLRDSTGKKASGLVNGISGEKVFERTKDSARPNRQSALTKTLIQLSTKRNLQGSGVPVPEDTAKEPGSLIVPESDPCPGQSIVSGFDLSGDQTVDLSQPRSRSGRHWKAEFDQYHKRSNREIRKILQYGQNVKSFALKKDYEASQLGEKLENELAKVARMEARVSRLAKQLSATQCKIPADEAGQSRLVGELAQQTALAVRYQRKAEHYQRAISKQAAVKDISITMEQNGKEEKAHHKQKTSKADSAPPHSGLHHETWETQDSCNSQLEAENRQLKRSLARVKEEMVSYESRRRAREERLQKRERRHLVAKQRVEAELVSLKNEHSKLLETLSNRRNEQERTANNLGPQASEAKQSDLLAAGASPQHIPPLPQHQTHLGNSAADIWVVSSPNAKPYPDNAIPLVEEATPIGPSSVGQDIRRVLKDINQNIVVSNQANERQPMPTKENNLLSGEDDEDPGSIATRGKAVQILPTEPRSLTPAEASPVKEQPPLPATVTRAASLYSSFAEGGTASRTNTMGSRRTLSLSAERTAAAKARLAERKRSAEKQKPWKGN